VVNGILICRRGTTEIGRDREALPPRLESIKYGERSSPVIFLNAALKQPD
jgi:hypothetical protein